MNKRRTPPNRREQLLFDFKHGAIGFVGAIGLDESGQPMEVFLYCEKTTSGLEALGRDAAILISLGLQHGCSIDTMRRAITREEDGSAATLTGQLLDEIEKLGLCPNDGDMPKPETLSAAE